MKHLIKSTTLLILVLISFTTFAQDNLIENDIEHQKNDVEQQEKEDKSIQVDETQELKDKDIDNTVISEKEDIESESVEEEISKNEESATNENVAKNLLSNEIIAYADVVMGTSIDRGECWDFVAFALDSVDASWERPKGFGKQIDWETESLEVGDVIFLSKADFRSPNKKKSAYFYKHYGLVYEVKESLSIAMVHQNYAKNKNVHLSDLDLSHLKRGLVEIYRPAKN